jgi:RNA polymerase sigma-70 factor (ECF subfamily)
MTFFMTSTHSTHYSLIENAKQRLPDAWDPLVEIYTPLIHAWCRRLGCKPDECDDLCQEVLFAASSSVDSFRGNGQSGSFRGWLWKITYRKWIDRYRKVVDDPSAVGGSTAANALQQVYDPNGQEFAEPSSSDMVHALLQRAMQMVRCEFQELHWQAFWRSVIDGIPTDVVAKQLQMTSASVRQSRSRILRRLRVIMGDAS